MAEKEPKPTEMQTVQNVKFEVVTIGIEIPPNELARLQDLGFVLKTAKLIPDRLGPKADIICVSGC